jgi:hypothetical protein
VNELQIFTPDADACMVNSDDFKGIDGHGAVYGYGHDEIYGQVVSSIEDGSPFHVDRHDCGNTIRLLHAFYSSDETGETVNVNQARPSARLGRINEPVSNLYRIPSPEDKEA